MEKLTKFIGRNASVITGKNNLEHLYSIKNFPVFFGCVDSNPEKDICMDMEWGIDPETGVIQLTKLVPLDVLYQSQHVDGCGPTWNQYYEDFSSFIAEQKPQSALEIGGGMGRLAELVVQQSPSTKWVIIEPNPERRSDDKIGVIKGFFDKSFSTDQKFDTIVFSQVLEHAYDPKEFLATIYAFLKPNGRLICAYPNLKLWLERKYTNALNFEHTMLFTDYFLDYMLAKVGFSISEKYAYKDHSYFYVAEKPATGAAIAVPPLENKYDEYKKIFMDFVKYHLSMVRDLNERIGCTENPVYLFGAHIFSQFLFCFGLRHNMITSILDNSPTKQGKRLYGTPLLVESPKVLKGKGRVSVILKAGIYNDEIKKDILDNINPDVIFW